MSEEGREFSSKTIEEAIQIGLAEMGLDRGEADIDIVQHPRRKFLGWVNAVVRITSIDNWEEDEEEEEEPIPQSRIAGQPEPEVETDNHDDEEDYEEDYEDYEDEDYDDKPSTRESSRRSRSEQRSQDEPAPTYDDSEGTPEGEEQNEEVAVQTLTQLLTNMGFESSELQRVWTGTDDGNPILTLNVRGGQLGRLIGRHGATLNSLQFILRLLLSQQLQEWPSITVDVDGYRLKQQANLTKRALRIADEVVNRGRPQTLEAMSAADRRIVHLALQDHPKVYTESKGSGAQRKIVVYAQ